MKVGETIKFVIPSHNAFGVVGDENRIGMNQSLISTVTLINIKKNED
jgi:FKBP-type peptidyl-prolyl cis-trans isomerase